MRATTRLLTLSVGGLLAASSFVGLTLSIDSQAAAVRSSPAASSARFVPARPLSRVELNDDPVPSTAVPVAAPVVRRSTPQRTVAARPAVSRVAVPSAGVYSYAALQALWVRAGGPSWAAAHAASIALCESGGRPWAHNPSGATGLWQILGGTGNLYDPLNNAINAVRKFTESGDTFAQWVCR